MVITMECADNIDISSLKRFREVKESLDEDDYITIGDKKYIKRSGWRKIASAFSLSLEIRSFDMIRDNDTVTAVVQARASLPDGRFSDNIGICDSSELNKIRNTPQNIAATALTRAINRCISDLIGNGELSAEEIIEIERNAITVKEEKEMDLSQYHELEYSEGKIMLKKYVDDDRFRAIREYLRQFGYRFSSEQRSFVKDI